MGGCGWSRPSGRERTLKRFGGDWRYVTRPREIERFFLGQPERRSWGLAGLSRAHPPSRRVMYDSATRSAWRLCHVGDCAGLILRCQCARSESRHPHVAGRLFHHTPRKVALGLGGGHMRKSIPSAASPHAITPCVCVCGGRLRGWRGWRGRRGALRGRVGRRTPRLQHRSRTRARPAWRAPMGPHPGLPRCMHYRMPASYRRWCAGRWGSGVSGPPRGG